MLRRSTYIALLIAALIPRIASSAADIRGVWMIEDEAAIQIADCADGSLCGRIVWLKMPHDAAGQPKRDQMNPDATLRQRLVCGLTIVRALRPAGPGRWEGGSFYDPRDGGQYNTAIELKSADVLIARIYLGLRIFGKSQTLIRAQGATKVGC